MSEKLTVEELVKTLRCCASRLCSACPASGANCVGGLDRMRQTADALESLTAERDGYREQLAAALAENTRLAQQAEHAHWTNKNDENVYVCSNCGHYCREFLIQQSGNIPIQGFCTECGAKMDKQE